MVWLPSACGFVLRALRQKMNAFQADEIENFYVSVSVNLSASYLGQLLLFPQIFKDSPARRERCV